MSDQTVGDALPKEISRVRDELMPMYESIGPPGAFALAMMRSALQRADQAMISQDLPEMIRVYQELKDFTA
jgi:hypothetical protein